MSHVFLSYRRADTPDAVARLYERLVARIRNREVFYDHRSIELGDEFPELLRHKVTTASVVLVVIGPKWVELLREKQSAAVDHVREEIRLALASQADVIPVLVGGAAMPSETALADFPDLLPLRARNAQTVRPDPLFADECDKLIAHLERTGPAELVGAMLAGKYKVQRLIGEGGMGDVYLAEQTAPVKRPVAIKVLKAGMDTKEVLARFDAERQALAVMDHPNVCKVLDAGQAPNGRPYFVMEYVRGVPITRFCDDRKLPPKERLELFMTVCRGVQHAHQKGIIHRDIKPGNVLVEVVDGKPVPKVIDFGLAKATGLKLTDQSFAPTEDGRWVGTLEYSSPEQAEGRFDIDTLTDMYSLGVLLYELLAGSPPFTREELLKTSEAEMRRVIRETEPSKPSAKLRSSANLPRIAADRQLEPAKLTSALQGDLDWIILKALDKAPDRRYPTPTALADDLHRHLTDQQISAGKPSAWRGIRKFARRNRGPVLATALVFFALLGGVVATTLMYFAAERSETLARQEAQAKQEALVAESAQRELAEANGQAASEQRAKAEANERRAIAGEKLALDRLARIERIVGPAADEATLHHMMDAAALLKKGLDPAVAKSVNVGNIKALNDQDPSFAKVAEGLTPLLLKVNMKDEKAVRELLKPSSVPGLIAMLKDSDAQVRLRAAQLLRIMGTDAKAAVPALIVAAKDREVLVRASAIAALATQGRDALPALPTLREALKDDEMFGVVAAAAALAIGKLGEEAKAAIPDLIEALKRRGIGATVGVLAAVQELGPVAADAAPEIAALLKESSLPFFRNACLNTLAKLGPAAHAAIPELVKILDGDHLDEKATACQILSHCPTTAAKALPGLLKGEKLRDYYSSLVELRDSIQDDSKPKQSLSPEHEKRDRSKDTNVASWATQVLASLDPPEPAAGVVLAENLTCGDALTREWAAFGLGRMGKAAAAHLPALKKARELDPSEKNRKVMDEAIADISKK